MEVPSIGNGGGPILVLLVGSILEWFTIVNCVVAGASSSNGLRSCEVSPVNMISKNSFCSTILKFNL